MSQLSDGRGEARIREEEMAVIRKYQELNGLAVDNSQESIPSISSQMNTICSLSVCELGFITVFICPFCHTINRRGYVFCPNKECPGKDPYVKMITSCKGIHAKTIFTDEPVDGERDTCVHISRTLITKLNTFIFFLLCLLF